jgi:XapX domain-containing protein
MKTYLLSLGVGLVVGILYSLLNVRSPAPPVVALVGLLGMLAGEQIVPAVRQMLAGRTMPMVQAGPAAGTASQHAGEERA